MGEAVLTRYGSQMLSVSGYIKQTQIFTISTDGYSTQNYNFTVPKCKDQKIDVLIFGGGGGAKEPGNSNYTGGGGGGNMNHAVLTLNQGDVIPISIGWGGSYYSNGSTTSFGTYLSATGGECGKYGNGGNGGTGGGGINGGIGGHGYYGGGGGGGIRYGYMCGNGGNGGTYGGGGGSGASHFNNNVANSAYGGKSIGGWGNGGNFKIDATDGLNTMNKKSVLDFFGYGKAGYIGVANISITTPGGIVYNKINYASKCCGGGGYGGNGGLPHIEFSEYYDNRYIIYGGGGGGYGADGANATIYGSGGGGGYGHTGKNGAGGGYGADGWGSGAEFTGSGKSGIAVISYLTPIQA